MKMNFFLAPALLGLALNTAAADEPRHAFECDTPAGHFSYWKRTVSAGAIDVSGKIRVNEMLKDKKWSSTAYVSLESEKSVKGRFGFRIFGIAKTPEFFFLELQKVGGREAIGIGRIAATKEPIPFTMSLDAAGFLKVTVAGADASAQLGAFKPETFELSCSTGDYEFTDVIITETSGTR